MDEELLAYLKTAAPEEELELLFGRIVQKKEFEDLEIEFIELIPKWMYFMLTRYPIAGLIFRFKTKKGVVRAIQFNDIGEVSDNYYQLKPGRFIASEGYVCIADDPSGDDAGYFINLAEGNNPPVYLVETTSSENPVEILEKTTTKVADKLSDVFKTQTARLNLDELD